MFLDVCLLRGHHTVNCCLDPALRCSEFISTDVPVGSIAQGVRHEDLQGTSFEDNSFDIVISGEVGRAGRGAPGCDWVPSRRWGMACESVSYILLCRCFPMSPALTRRTMRCAAS